MENKQIKPIAASISLALLLASANLTAQQVTDKKTDAKSEKSTNTQNDKKFAIDSFWKEFSEAIGMDLSKINYINLRRLQPNEKIEKSFTFLAGRDEKIAAFYKKWGVILRKGVEAQDTAALYLLRPQQSYIKPISPEILMLRLLFERAPEEAKAIGATLEKTKFDLDKKDLFFDFARSPEANFAYSGLSLADFADKEKPNTPPTPEKICSVLTKFGETQLERYKQGIITASSNYELAVIEVSQGIQRDLLTDRTCPKIIEITTLFSIARANSKYNSDFAFTYADRDMRYVEKLSNAYVHGLIYDAGKKADAANKANPTNVVQANFPEIKVLKQITEYQGRLEDYRFALQGVADANKAELGKDIQTFKEFAGMMHQYGSYWLRQHALYQQGIALNVEMEKNLKTKLEQDPRLKAFIYEQKIN